MSIDTADEIVALLPGVKARFYAPAVTVGAYSVISLWTFQGVPGPGIAPVDADGEIPDSDTDGAMRIPAPVAAQVIKVARARARGTKGGTLVIYDRLYHQSGLDMTVGGTWTQPPLTRPDAIGEDVEVWLESWAAAANSAGDITISYTNSENVSGRTGTFHVPASLEEGEMVPCVLQAGDTGVRSVQSMTAALTAAGDVGITLLRPLIEIPLAAESEIHDAIKAGLALVDDEACLAAYVETGSGGSTGVIDASLNLIQG